MIGGDIRIMNSLKVGAFKNLQISRPSEPATFRALDVNILD
jgi:hypothetical protein